MRIFPKRREGREDFPILVILKQAGTGAYRSATGGSPPSTGAGIPQKEEIGRKSSWLGSTLGSLLLGYRPPFDPRLDRQDRFPLLNMYENGVTDLTNQVNEFLTLVGMVD